MKKIFIWRICSECKEPIETIDVCSELGYNDFNDNFHGDMSIEETEKMRMHLINKLIEDGKSEEAKDIHYNTAVLEVEFK